LISIIILILLMSGDRKGKRKLDADELARIEEEDRLAALTPAEREVEELWAAQRASRQTAQAELARAQRAAQGASSSGSGPSTSGSYETTPEPQSRAVEQLAAMEEARWRAEGAGTSGYARVSDSPIAIIRGRGVNATRRTARVTKKAVKVVPSTATRLADTINPDNSLVSDPTAHYGATGQMPRGASKAVRVGYRVGKKGARNDIYQNPTVMIRDLRSRDRARWLPAQQEMMRVVEEWDAHPDHTSPYFPRGHAQTVESYRTMLADQSLRGDLLRDEARIAAEAFAQNTAGQATSLADQNPPLVHNRRIQGQVTPFRQAISKVLSNMLGIL
jgi:hypothetical protein